MYVIGVRHIPLVTLLAAAMLLTGNASGQDAAGDSAMAGLRILAIEPAHVLRDAATLEVKVTGSGFGANPSVKFMQAGTQHPGGIVVRRAHALNPRQLILMVEIDRSVVPGTYDIGIRNAGGSVTLGKKLFLVEPYSWAARFGCTGAESWRRRIPCRRGTIY